MHTFLTGGTGVGKTTIINDYLALAHLSADGFSTGWADEPGERRLYLRPFGNNSERHLLGRWADGRVQPVDDVTEVFDTQGARLVEAAGRRDVIVMDEIGCLESAALRFQAAIMARVAGDVPIIGVLRSPARSARCGFVNMLRLNPSLTVREITAHNRDEVLGQLLAESGGRTT